jgi:predicted transcriptional regulator
MYDNLVTIGADALSLTDVDELNKVIDSLLSKMRASKSFDYKMAIEEILELLEPYRDSLQAKLSFEDN